ncbi:Arabinose efflux permease [Roseibium album]|uniref:Arabinose efflux permease n=1 Tax=Roseibium album TaxID=311410 RepID=A0A0M7A7A3_9HYPH|nr:Arabinose efflux permease [Roseibium album]CTQ68135.1 Arabinose efflux permease [Roseibium album]CTQ70497.1 Arabinose efflux permease [Roseibium album]
MRFIVPPVPCPYPLILSLEHRPLSRISTFCVYLLAVFLQAGAYGLTFMLPRLYSGFGANEKAVGVSLFIATASTLLAVYYAGHLSDWFGRVATLGMACLSIGAALGLFGLAVTVGSLTVIASILLGAGWGLTYALAPVVLTRLVSAQERVRYFALHSVVLMAGFGLSPVMAAKIEKAGGSVSDAFFITAIGCLVSALLFFVLIRPVRSHAINAGPEASSRLSLKGVGTILRSRALVPVVMVFLGASVFAGLNNFQTVFADERGLDYADFFLVYTITVVICRIALAQFKGGRHPYLTIALLQYVMAGSVLLFIFSGTSQSAYVVVAILFGIGYGASYPILVAMAANDANHDLVPQTLQLFALTYFIGIFGFPLVAGWMIVDVGVTPLLGLIVVMAAFEATMALLRVQKDALAAPKRT